MHNEQSSVPMSPSESRRDSELSEADYLAREVADAKAALTESLAGLKLGLSNSADVRQWVKHYPWASLGAATAAGFAAAAAVTPAKGESINDKIARLRRNWQPTSADDSPSAATQINSPRRTSVSDQLISSVFDLAKVLVQTLIVSILQRPAAAENPAPSPAESRATSMDT
jgi:hypothetical protein